MTLEELLALLPDNTAGEISAADLRTIVTELFNTGAGLRTDVNANATGITNLGHDLTAVDTAQQQTAAGLVTTNQNMDGIFQQVQALDGRVTTLESASGGDGGAYSALPMAGHWTYNSTVDASPTAGQVAFDNMYWDSASKIRIAAVDAEGVDWSAYFAQFNGTCTIFMTGWGPAYNSNTVLYNVTNSLDNQGGYYEWEVAAGSAQGGPPMLTDVALVFTNMRTT